MTGDGENVLPKFKQLDLKRFTWNNFFTEQASIFIKKKKKKSRIMGKPVFIPDQKIQICVGLFFIWVQFYHI